MVNAPAGLFLLTVCPNSLEVALPDMRDQGRGIRVKGCEVRAKGSGVLVREIGIDALGRDPVCHISIGAMNEGASIGGTVSRSYEARTNTKA